MNVWDKKFIKKTDFYQTSFFIKTYFKIIEAQKRNKAFHQIKFRTAFS